jgi:Family of unknown function (DUF6481)
MGGFKDLSFVERRNAAADAKKAVLKKFREHAAEPVGAEQQKAPATDAAGSRPARRAKDKKRAISRKTDTSK